MLKRKTKQTAKEASEEWMDISGKFQITNILAKLKQWKHKIKITFIAMLFQSFKFETRCEMHTRAFCRVNT